MNFIGRKIHIILILLVAFSEFTVRAELSETELYTKAYRFFKYREWKSALEVYDQILKRDPKSVDSYCYAIVSAGMQQSPKLQYSLFRKAINKAISFDTIFSGVRDLSVKLVRPDIYTDFMKMLKTKEIWLERPINIRLLWFYTFRKDAENMIDIGEKLLRKDPGNVNFLGAMADGYALKGDYKSSLEYYNKILLLDGDDYESLLALGNYYYIEVTKALGELGLKLSDIKSSASEKIMFLSVENNKEIINQISISLGYLERAGRIKMTPFIKNMIVSLRTAQNTIH